MNIIPAGHAGIVVFNVFPVRPDNQQALVDCIRGGGDVSGIPGLLGMRLLRSLDGTQVINHMHWASEAAFRTATAGDPRIGATMSRVHDLVEGTGPYRYEVAAVLK